MRHFPIISRDRIRFSLLKNEDAYFSNEKEVFEQFCSEIAKWLKKGKSCVADATHLNITSRARLINKLEKAESDEERQEMLEQAINGKWKDFYPISKKEKNNEIKKIDDGVFKL
jgi:predicted kinase